MTEGVIILLRKSMDWFLYDVAVCHERVKYENCCFALKSDFLDPFKSNEWLKRWMLFTGKMCEKPLREGDILLVNTNYLLYP